MTNNDRKGQIFQYHPIKKKLILFFAQYKISQFNVLSYDSVSRIEISPFIIYKVMKYRKILIKYNAYFKKAVFHSRENIKSCIFTAVKI